MKNYIGILRDHSGSMSGLKNRAMKDYNEQIEEIKQNSRKADGSLRATYLSDGSFHDNFVPGIYHETPLVEGQTVSVTVGPQK